MILRRRQFLALSGGSLLLAACGRLGSNTPRKGPLIGMLQMVDAPPPNLTREGFEQALAAAGYRNGETVTFLQKDAAGELPNTTLVMQQFLSEKVDMVLAVGTPPLQAAMKVMPQSVPVIFCYCSNPWGAGAGTPPGGVGQHRPNVVGTVGTNPVGKELDLAREINPQLKRVGLIFNPGEPNSDYEAKILRREAQQRGLELVEQSVANSGEVLQAAKALAAKEVEAFVKIGDYATIQAFASICKVGLEHRIPVYSVDPPDIQLPGCLAVIGWNYRDDGMAAGQLAVRVLKGESPSQMAFEPLKTTDLLVSLATAKAIGVTVPQDLVERADQVVR
ncbi:ABC transporter substrate-binding protein [Vulcanococcus sp. Clear-D1]|uniref:ABC transporter substrate-binding protein n=1 Tax=Vulcanococcus sp. Clear-D1 TaxID=2766970 RepID=UPI0019C6CEC2|nr:ABC transporter substrate-binding protein [Vulcanococcus sp. Clear-D1]MBD1194130.1 ABC transporter substrate-binding protein [Vulcanococcus sp. Clear-D1]